MVFTRNYIEGRFRSSGVAGDADSTMDRLTEVARKRREEQRFFGYIHLKGVVGASAEALQRAGRWADRLSANIEPPSQQDLDRLAPERTIAAAEDSMRTLHTAIRAAKDARRAPTRSPAARAAAPRSTPGTRCAASTTPPTARSRAVTRTCPRPPRRCSARLRAPLKRILPFVVTADGWQQTRLLERSDAHGQDLDTTVRAMPRQLMQFEAAGTSRAGEL